MAQKKKKQKTRSKPTKKIVNKASKKSKSKTVASSQKHKKKQVTKSHKAKTSQTRSVKKKIKQTAKKPKKKTQISKAKKSASKKAAVKTVKSKNTKKLFKTKASKSNKNPSKKVITKTQKKDQLKKMTSSVVKKKLKKTKKTLEESKLKTISKGSKKAIQKTSTISSKKDKKNIPVTRKAPTASPPKTTPKPQKTDKETFYDAIETAFHNEQVVLTNAEGKQFCHHKDCDQVASTDIYCRHHYILLWKLIQRKKKILEGHKLKQFIQDISLRYSDKFLDMIRKNLSTDRDFTITLQELEITQGPDTAQDYQDNQKDISLEDDHIPFSDDRPET